MAGVGGTTSEGQRVLTGEARDGVILRWGRMSMHKKADEMGISGPWIPNW
jgi:hypothetical protein